jgi:hypothetical protein
VFLTGLLNTASAQDPDAPQQPRQGGPLATFEVGRTGPQLLGVSVSTTYYSNGVPEGSFQPGLALASDVAIAAGATVGYTHMAPRTSFSATYSGSYIGRVRYSSLSTSTHLMDAHFRHNFTPRLMLDSSLSFAILNLEQFQFTPNSAAALTSSAASFTDLANGVMSGTSASSQPVNLPPGALLYGTRTATTSLRTGLTYLSSPRTTWYVNAVATRTQVAGHDAADTNTPFLPQSTSTGVEVGVSYSLTPRTQLRGDVSSIKTLSSFDRAYTHSATMSFTRKIGQSWFATVQGGTGLMTGVHSSFAPPQGPQYLAGGNLGFTTHHNTIVISYSRTLGESYTYGAFSTQIAQAAWQWSIPGRPWSMSANFSRQVFDGGLFGGSEGWQVAANVGRSLGRGIGWQLGYAYLYYTMPGTALLGNFNQGMVRVTLRWGI